VEKEKKVKTDKLRSSGKQFRGIRGVSQSMQQSIDISRPAGPQQQTCHTLLQLSIDGTDRQTDGRAVSINKP